MDFSEVSLSKATIQTDQLLDNIGAFKELLSEKTKFMAVVKANAYSHGAIPLARKMEEAQAADYFGVAQLREALELRSEGIQTPILLFNSVRFQEIKRAIQEKITMTVFSKEVASQIVEVAEQLNQQAEEHAELIVLVGGLGPDDDDITKQAISEYVEIPLVLDHISEDKIITYHKNSDLEMPEKNQLQALVIQDSIPIQNATGLATGMFFEHGKQTFILLPGPFDELKPTFLESVQPLIIEELLEDRKIETRYLNVFGISEAKMKKQLKDFVGKDSSSFMGVYKRGEEFEIQITAQAENKEDAANEADKIKEDLKNHVQEYVYSEEGQTLLETVKNLLMANDLTVTAAESLTGGEFLSRFSSEPEASAVFSGGIVTYSTEVKNQVLGVSKDITDEFGVVSPQCAIDMAEKSKEMFQADVGISLTGVAGPASLEGEIPGTVWIGIAKEGMESFAKQFHFAYKRNRNRSLSVLSAMNLVRLVILDKEIQGKVFMDDEDHKEGSVEEVE